MRVTDKAAQVIAKPMVAPGIPLGFIHTLLDHGPVTGTIQQKNVMINLITILKRIIIYFGY